MHALTHPHVCTAGTVVCPPEDLCHVLQHIHDGQQVSTVAGPITGRLPQFGHHFWNSVSHKATLCFGQVLSCLMENVASVRFHTSQQQPKNLFFSNIFVKLWTCLTQVTVLCEDKGNKGKPVNFDPISWSKTLNSNYLLKFHTFVCLKALLRSQN